MEKIIRVSLTDWLIFLKEGLEKSEKIKLLYSAGEFKEDRAITELGGCGKEMCYENACCV